MKTIAPILILFCTLSAYSQQKITFDCDKVKRSTELLPTENYGKAIQNLAGAKIEAFLQEHKGEQMIPARFHPFMYTLQLAYDQHYPVSISPDMIWLLISQGMAQHINNQSSSLRNKFVKFDGKKKISIDTRRYGNFIKGSPQSPWEKLTPVFSDSIRSHIGNEFYQAMTPDFSTTNATIKTTYEITLMNSMNKFFNYEARTLCGIPEITIEGTPDDWKTILKNTQALKKYGAAYWVKELEPLLQQFIKASKGKIDKAFWQDIYKLNGGSGGPYISGWIIKFFPYVGETATEKNQYLHTKPEGIFAGLTSVMLTTGQAQAPFVWLYYRERFEMAFVAGFIGIKQDPQTYTLRPEIGWYVRELKPEITKRTD